MHVLGEGLAPDAAQGLRYYEQAAALGDGAAQFNLGFMYANAQGTAQNYPLALHWYQTAAGQAPALALALPTPAPAPLATPAALLKQAA